MPCFECDDTGRCSCITCGYDTQEGRKSGPCVVCAGRAFNERHAAILASVDPRERRHWRRIPAHDGTPASLVFLPFEGLK